MARICQRCRQPCTDQEGSCPRCGTNVLTVASLDTTPAPAGQLERNAVAKPRLPKTDSAVDFDIGAPDELTGPPSGASFVSWGALAAPPSVPEDNPEDKPVVMGTASSARFLLDQAEHVDLASPIGVPPSGPPSGASFVSWGSLASAQHVQRRTRWRLVLLALIGIALAAGLALRLLGLV